MDIIGYQEKVRKGVEDDDQWRVRNKDIVERAQR